MKLMALTIAGVLAFPVLTGAEETLTEKAKDAAQATGETIEGAAKKVVAEAKELFTDEEARKVPVTLEEGKIDLPARIGAGKTRFVVTNEGSKKHNFEIAGEGIEESFWIGLDPGHTKNLDVELKSGEYRVSCPLEGEAEKGMKKTLRVK